MDEIKRSRTFVWSTETPYNGFYGWEHSCFGHIAKSCKIELRRLELHGCASHPPGRYSATGGALARALVRFARPNAPHTQQNRQKLGFRALHRSPIGCPTPRRPRGIRIVSRRSPTPDHLLPDCLTRLLPRAADPSTISPHKVLFGIGPHQRWDARQRRQLSPHKSRCRYSGSTIQLTKR